MGDALCVVGCRGRVLDSAVFSPDLSRMGRVKGGGRCGEVPVSCRLFSSVTAPVRILEVLGNVDGCACVLRDMRSSGG